MRKYAALWKRIAANEEQNIICPERGIKAISAAIYNEKYRNQIARKDTELPGFGRIEIIREPLLNRPGMVRLRISIKYSGDNL